jgi:hypothetical protein
MSKGRNPSQGELVKSIKTTPKTLRKKMHEDASVLKLPVDIALYGTRVKRNLIPKLQSYQLLKWKRKCCAAV